MNTFLSVIIPVYNVEKYLNQCVDSVISQGLDNIEIILVDDGSTDTSSSICDQYAFNYGYIQVIHKDNGGLSSARNEGIKVAKGEYLVFIDSDDFWNKDVNVSKMLEIVKQEEKEMYLFTSFDYLDGTYLKRNEHNNLKNIRTDTVLHYYEDLLNNGNLEVSACTKFLKTSFIEDNDLYFTNKLLSEDNEWMLRLLRCLKTVDILDEPLYLCRTNRSDSITHTIKKKNISDLLLIINNSISYHNNHERLELKSLELCYCSYLWFSALGLTVSLDNKTKKELKPDFIKTSEVLQYSNSKKTRLCNSIYKLFGFNITCWILGRYIVFKNKKVINRKQVNA